jgi:MFS family permease
VTPRSEALFTRPFIALWIFQFFTFFGVFQLLPVIPLRIVDLGGSKTAAGSFLFVYTIASAFSAPIMGSIADHWGRRRMLVTASVMFVVFSILYGIVPWLPVVLIVGLAHGALWSAILSSAGAIMSDFIPAARRTEGLAYWGLAPTAAMALAPAAGMQVYRFGWGALCLEMALLSAFTSIWASRLPSTEAVNRAELRAMPNVRELWDMNVARATLSLTVIAFGYGGVTSYIALLARERKVMPESLFFTVFALATVVVRVFMSRLGDRYGHKVLLYPALVATPIAFLLLAYVDSRTEMIVAGTLFGAGMGAAFPAFMNFVMTHTDERRRGRTFGSVIWAFDTGIGLGSIVMGAIGQRFGLGRAFLVAAAISCLSIPIFVATSRYFQRGTAIADTGEHAGT